jgi:protein-tyrosine phosphatase
MTAPWTRILQLDAVNNFRDFGGWRTDGGGRVATGRLFRSAHHARATAADVDRIAGLGIATVADLRHVSEQKAQPSAWAGKLAFDMIAAADGEGESEGEAPHRLAFRKSDFSPDAMRAFMTAHYALIPYEPQHIALFGRYFDALSTRDGGMLIHCAAGKDRTGILAGLTHHVLGVHPDDAMDDYLLTNAAGNIDRRLTPVRRRMEKIYGCAISEEAMQVLLGVEPRYIASCWTAIEERSGSTDAYLANMLGVDEAKRRRIRERFIT